MKWKWWPARVTRPVLRIKSPLHHFNACEPVLAYGQKWCSWQDLHLHWRRSRRRASALGYANKGMELAKEIRRLLHRGVIRLAARQPRGEGWSQSPVLPWTRRAYETCLSAGSTAVLADGQHETPSKSWLVAAGKALDLDNGAWNTSKSVMKSRRTISNPWPVSFTDSHSAESGIARASSRSGIQNGTCVR